MEKRKTINGEDILWAMQNLGFDNYHDTLKLHLNKCREVRTSVFSVINGMPVYFRDGIRKTLSGYCFSWLNSVEKSSLRRLSIQ